ELQDGRRIHRHRRPVMAFCAVVRPFPQAAAPSGWAFRKAAHHRGFLAGLDREEQVRRVLEEPRYKGADHAQGADICADRRTGRSPDNLTARTYRRLTQLGLPVLLAARRDPDVARPDECWIFRGSAELAGMAVACSRRKPPTNSNHVRPAWGTAADGMAGGPAFGETPPPFTSDLEICLPSAPPPYFLCKS